MLAVAVVALLAAGCSSSDDDDSASGGGDAKAATCQGKTGEDQTPADYGSDNPDGTGKKVGMVFDIGGKDDKSFNESAFDGISAAAENMKVTAKELEPSADGSNREALLRQLAQDGYGLVIGVGFNFAEVLDKVAADYPETKFAIVDSVVDAPNVASLTFAEEQGSYLVGAAAAQSTETDKVGFMGGVESELIKKFQAGYEAGVAKVNPDVEVDVKYITPDGDFSGFNDPAKGETISAGLYDAGDDVVFHAAGGSGTGLFKAAASADRLAIGVDSNQYFQVPADQQKCMLSSMVKRVDVAVYDTIRDWVADDFTGGTTVFDLSNGGIDYATEGGQIKDTAELNDLKQDIIDGKIKVPTTP